MKKRYNINIYNIHMKNFNFKRLIFPLVLSCIILIIGLLFLIIGKKSNVVWPFVAIGQLAIGLMMIFAKLGLFTSYSHSQRRYIKSRVEKRNKKIGVFTEKAKDKPKVYLKQYNSPVDIEKKNKAKSWLPSLLITLIGFVETIIVLIIYFI